MEYISTKCKCTEFLSALSESSQLHVANYIEAKGRYRTEYGNIWPLTDHQKFILDVNEESLVDLLDPECGLLSSLYSVQVINERQRQTVSSKPTKFQKNKSLMEILRRGSIGEYKKMIKCLHDTNQSHIAKILEEGGAVVRIHSELGDADEKTEDELVASFAKVLQNKPLEQSRRIFEKALNVIALMKSQSIIIYILCKNLRELTKLKEMQLNGKLRIEVRNLYLQLLPPFVLNMEITADSLYEITESIFTQLLRQSQISDVSVNLAESEYDRCKSHLTMLEIAKISKTAINDLPLELLDIILQKSYIYSVLKENKSFQYSRDEDVIKQLSTVGCCWSLRMSKKSFKKILWSMMKNYYRKKSTQHFIYRGNRQLFLESLNARSKINSMKSDANNSGARKKWRFYIQRHQQLQCQAMQCTSIRPLKNEREMDLSMRYFDHRGQNMSSKVRKKGGAAVRIEIQCYQVYNKAEQTQQLVERVNCLIHDRTTRSRDQEVATNQLKHDDIEILNAVEDREAIIWILCKSFCAVEKLKSAHKSNNFLDFFCDPMKEILKVTTLNCINLDSDQLKKEMVMASKTSANVIGNIFLKEKSLGPVGGVTKLRNRIYVLCRITVDLVEGLDTINYCNAIFVFEEKSPFNLQKEIELEDHRVLVDIRSSEMQGCLYILDASSNSVWKIQLDDQMEHTIDRRWLQFEHKFRPQILSLSRDDQLLVATLYSPVCIRIYESNVKLRLAIQLNQDIENPCCALEASNGNFIILHALEQEAITNEDKKQNKKLLCTVSKVSRDGSAILHRFVSKHYWQKLDVNLFFGRGAICIDSDDRVHVADMNNNRIVLLDSFLRWVDIVIPTQMEEGKEKDKRVILQCPNKLFYDEIKEQFIVADIDKISIYVFKQQYHFYCN